MRNNDYLLTGLGCLGAISLVALMAIVFPLFYAAGGYFTGWILSAVFPFAGDWIVSGAKPFGMEITRQSLPLIGAFLGFLGAFFKSHQSNTNNSKK